MGGGGGGGQANRVVPHAYGQSNINIVVIRSKILCAGSNGIPLKLNTTFSTDGLV